MFGFLRNGMGGPQAGLNEGMMPPRPRPGTMPGQPGAMPGAAPGQPGVMPPSAMMDQMPEGPPMTPDDVEAGLNEGGVMDMRDKPKSMGDFLGRFSRESLNEMDPEDRHKMAMALMRAGEQFSGREKTMAEYFPHGIGGGM